MRRDYRQYFGSATDSEDVWKRLHCALEPFGVTHIFYGVGYLAEVITQEHLARFLEASTIAHKFNFKTSYPDELLNISNGEYRFDQDPSALHVITHLTPFVWSDHPSPQSQVLTEKHDSEQSFWFNVKLIGVTLPLRFGNFGRGGVGLYMSRLSEKEFNAIWNENQIQIVSIVDEFDRTVRSQFLDLVGISVTKRERDILALLAQGLSAKMIAESLGTKANTVQNQISGLRTRLGARNNVQLATIATTFEMI